MPRRRQKTKVAGQKKETGLARDIRKTGREGGKSGGEKERDRREKCGKSEKKM